MNYACALLSCQSASSGGYGAGAAGPDFGAVMQDTGINPAVGGGASAPVPASELDMLSTLELKQELEKTKEALEMARANEGTFPAKDRYTHMKERCAIMLRILKNRHSMDLKEVKTLVGENTKLRETNEEQGVLLAKLTQENTELRLVNVLQGEQIVTLKQEVSSKSATIAEQTIALDQAVKKSADTELALTHVSAKSKDLERALTLAEKKAATVERGFYEQQTKRLELEKEVIGYRQVAPTGQIDHLKGQLEKQDMRYRAEYARFHAEKTAEQEKNMRLTKQLEQITEVNKTLSANIETKEDMFKRVLADKEALQEKNARLSHELAQAKNSMSASLQTNESLLNRVLAENKALREASGKLEQENQSLKLSLAQIPPDARSAHESLEHFKRENLALKLQNRQLSGAGASAAPVPIKQEEADA